MREITHLGHFDDKFYNSIARLVFIRIKQNSLLCTLISNIVAFNSSSFSFIWTSKIINMKIKFLFLFAVIFVFLVLGEAQQIEEKDYQTVEEFLRPRRSPLMPKCAKGFRGDFRGKCRRIIRL